MSNGLSHSFQFSCSLYKLPSGRWCAQITHEGHRVSKSFDTQREGLEWIRKTLGQIDHGLTYASTTVTLEEFLESWLIITKASKRHSTWVHYDHLTRKYVLPSLGRLKLKELRPDNIQAFYNFLLASDIGVYTIIKLHTMLHSALGHAVKSGLASRNVTEAAIPPKAPDREMEILDENQVSQLLIVARGSRYEALLHVAVATGMRQMELLGLKWQDLDWSKQTITVQRQLVRSSKLGTVEFVPPKTKNGRRTVALGNRTIEALRSQYEHQQSDRMAAGDVWSEHDLIFTTRYGGPVHYRNLLRDFKNLLRKAGLPEIRFHDLRHTAASLMLNYGIPVIVVSRRLGHARASITLDIYGHLMPSMQAEAAELIDNLITPVAVQLNTTEVKP